MNASADGQLNEHTSTSTQCICTNNAPRAWMTLAIAGITSVNSAFKHFPGNALNKNSASNPVCRRCNEFCLSTAKTLILSFSVNKSHHGMREEEEQPSHLDAELVELHSRRLELLLLFVLSRTELYAIQLVNLKQRYFRLFLNQRNFCDLDWRYAFTAASDAL